MSFEVCGNGFKAILKAELSRNEAVMRMYLYFLGFLFFTKDCLFVLEE